MRWKGICGAAKEEEEKKEGEEEMSLTNDEINILIDAAKNQASYFAGDGYYYEHISDLDEECKEYGRQQTAKGIMLRNIMKKLEGMVKK